jgi:hypothetical protein
LHKVAAQQPVLQAAVLLVLLLLLHLYTEICVPKKLNWLRFRVYLVPF